MLHISSKTYAASDSKYDGSIDVSEDASKKTYALAPKGDANDWSDKKEIRLKVNKPKTAASQA